VGGSPTDDQVAPGILHEPTSQLFKLHAKLDALVLQAYGFNPGDDLLTKLLELNQELSEKEEQGETVVGPWAPT